MKKLLIILAITVLFAGCFTEKSKEEKIVKNAQEEIVEMVYEPITSADYLDDEPVTDDEIVTASAVKRATKLEAGTYTTVSGMVFYSNESPAVGVYVKITGATYSEGFPKSVNRRVKTDKDGKFTIKNVLKGSYTVGVEVKAGSTLFGNQIVDVQDVSQEITGLNIWTVSSPESGIIYGNAGNSRGYMKFVGDSGTFYSVTRAGGSYKAILPVGKYSVYSVNNRDNEAFTEPLYALGTVYAEAKANLKTKRDMRCKDLIEVYLVQDVETSGNAERILKQLNVPYTKWTSAVFMANVGNIGLDRMIIFDSNQPKSFYDTIKSFDNYYQCTYDIIFLCGDYQNTFRYGTTFTKSTSYFESQGHIYSANLETNTAQYYITTKTAYASNYCVNAEGKPVILEYLNDKYGVSTFVGFDDSSTLQNIIQFKTQKAVDFNCLER